MKFKVGDRVCYKSIKISKIDYSDVGTITSINYGTAKVKWDKVDYNFEYDFKELVLKNRRQNHPNTNIFTFKGK
jgi:hypothetical protein